MLEKRGFMGVSAPSRIVSNKGVSNNLVSFYQVVFKEVHS